MSLTLEILQSHVAKPQDSSALRTLLQELQREIPYLVHTQPSLHHQGLDVLQIRAILQQILVPEVRVVAPQCINPPQSGYRCPIHPMR
jgi:predicted nucleotidyltransferase